MKNTSKEFPGRSSINIDDDVLKEMRVEKAHTGKELYALVREAWELYKLRSGAESAGSGSSSVSKSKVLSKLLVEGQLQTPESSVTLDLVTSLGQRDKEILLEVAAILQENDDWLRTLVLRAIELRKSLIAGPPKRSKTTPPQTTSDLRTLASKTSA